MGSDAYTLFILVGGILTAIFIFMALRELWLWYFKINDVLKELIHLNKSFDDFLKEYLIAKVQKNTEKMQNNIEEGQQDPVGEK